MSKSRFFLQFSAAALSVVAFVGVAAAQEPTPVPTPNKGQCRSFPNKLRALNKQIISQTSKQARTQVKADEIQAKIDLIPTPTPTPDPSATASAEAGNGKGNGGKKTADERKLATLLKQLENISKKIARIVERIADVNGKIEDINTKSALCPTPTPTPTPTASQ